MHYYTHLHAENGLLLYRPKAPDVGIKERLELNTVLGGNGACVFVSLNPGSLGLLQIFPPQKDCEPKTAVLTAPFVDNVGKLGGAGMLLLF